MKDETTELHHDTTEKYQQFPTPDARTFACLIYVLSFFTTVVGPLIIWLLKGQESEFINQTAKNYFNYFISYIIWSFVSLLLMFVLIGFVIAPIIALVSFIFSIIAAVKAYNGEDYVIPLTIRFIK